MNLDGVFKNLRRLHLWELTDDILREKLAKVARLNLPLEIITSERNWVCIPSYNVLTQ